jgi:hypothetical protein
MAMSPTPLRRPRLELEPVRVLVRPDLHARMALVERADRGRQDAHGHRPHGRDLDRHFDT